MTHKCPRCGRATLGGECMAATCPACPAFVAHKPWCEAGDFAVIGGGVFGRLGTERLPCTCERRKFERRVEYGGILGQYRDRYTNDGRTGTDRRGGEDD